MPRKRHGTREDEAVALEFLHEFTGIESLEDALWQIGRDAERRLVADGAKPPSATNPDDLDGITRAMEWLKLELAPPLDLSHSMALEVDSRGACDSRYATHQAAALGGVRP